MVIGASFALIPCGREAVELHTVAKFSSNALHQFIHLIMKIQKLIKWRTNPSTVSDLIARFHQTLIDELLPVLRSEVAARLAPGLAAPVNRG